MNWWKVIAIVLIIIAVCLVMLKSCGNVLSKVQSVPEDYTKTVSAGAEIEAKYLAMGSHDVSYVEYGALMSFEKYEIYYPSDIAEMEGSLPAVIFVNGTGVAGSKYQALQKHMASWGFITVATEEAHAWNGFSAEMSVRMLEMLNGLEGKYMDKDNVLFGKVDVDNIGITGHSQGGYGVVNAITDQKHKDSYRAAVILSSAPYSENNDFQWEADPSLIQTPTMMLSSMGNFDAAVASMESLQNVYSSISKEVPKVLARRTEGDHGEMLYYGDGYVTAWFMYWLQGDNEAGKAFFGESAELTTNANWKDVKISGNK
ncbi:MAG: hypothetical protein Q4F21_11080 [Lachnospiraceae bacterium]|nr:hypothetical protein [Lachnospiraceae bacterium]